MSPSGAKTAFVFAGGGSLGAVQVGMLRTLLSHGVRPEPADRDQPAIPARLEDV